MNVFKTPHDRRRYEYFHLTLEENLDAIMKEGLIPGKYLKDLYLGATPEDCIQLAPVTCGYRFANMKIESLSKGLDTYIDKVRERIPPVNFVILSVDMFGLENNIRPRTNYVFDNNELFLANKRMICEYLYQDIILPERIHIFADYVADVISGVSIC